MGGFLFKMTKDNLTPKDITLDKAKEYADFANKVADKIIVIEKGRIIEEKEND